LAQGSVMQGVQASPLLGAVPPPPRGGGKRRLGAVLLAIGAALCVSSLVSDPSSVLGAAWVALAPGFLLPAVAAPAALPPTAAGHSSHWPRLPTLPQMTATMQAPMKVLVMDGTGSFYNSRTMFEKLHEHSRVTLMPFGSDVNDAKKMLLSRQTRYNGLYDSLDFRAGGAPELAAALADAEALLILNADAATVGDQVRAAVGAGVKRVVVHVLATDTPAVDTAALESELAKGGVAYTIMRTGVLNPKSQGSGLQVSALDLPTCGEISREDAFRFLVEALTLDEANGRAFSLCTSERTEASLKAMRYAGSSRREEVAALLKGEVLERDPDEPLASVAKTTALPMVSEEEREEELKRIFASAKEKAEIRQKQMAYEEQEKKLKRAEMAELYGAARDANEAEDEETTRDGEASEKAEESTRDGEADVDATPAPTPEDRGNVPAPMR